LGVATGGEAKNVEALWLRGGLGTGLKGVGRHESHTRTALNSELGKMVRPVEHEPHTRLPHCLQ
jgi:hypothetical protein